MEIKVLTHEEIVQLKTLNEERNQLIENFGITEYQIQKLQQQKEQYKEDLKQLNRLEIQLGKELQDKYGEGSIDLQKGEFISS